VPRVLERLEDFLGLSDEIPPSGSTVRAKLDAERR
jgi:hypothetical protein